MHMSCTYELLCIKKSKHKEQYFVKINENLPNFRKIHSRFFIGNILGYTQGKLSIKVQDPIDKIDNSHCDK